MSTRLMTLCFDARDPLRLARFWSGALHWDIADETDDEEIELVPTDGTGFSILFLRVPEPSATKSRIHLDLVSESREHQSEMVDQLIASGAQRVDIGQGDVPWVVLADPEGNEFCVVIRGDFMATTGLLGGIVFEPAEYVVGRFWSEATGWPIVFDEDGDTSIRAPDGRGPFITFGPPTGERKTGKNRLHLDVAPPPDGDTAAEAERLIVLGARRIDIGQGDVSWIVLADPDGNEFCVLKPQ